MPQAAALCGVFGARHHAAPCGPVSCFVLPPLCSIGSRQHLCSRPLSAIPSGSLVSNDQEDKLPREGQGRPHTDYRFHFTRASN
jgi:hypothetical protein